MKKPTPPAYALGSLVLLAILSWLDLGIPGLPAPVRVLGAVLLVAGAALTVVAERRFQAAETAVSPFDEPSALVVRGPYRFTRNPMYLGMVAVVAGIALLVGRPLALIAPAGLAIALDRIFIRMEERALVEHFGTAYEEYSERVRRWL